MKNTERFDYFYGRTAENYTFCQVPKILLSDKRYRKISSSAKLLYGILLDKASLSFKNNYVDDSGRVYVIYTIIDVMEAFCCSNKTAVSILAELDTESGVGLIEKKRRGMGRPNIIYVKDFTTDAVYDEDDTDPDEEDENPSEKTAAPAGRSGRKSKKTTEEEAPEEDAKAPAKPVNTKKCKNYTSRNVAPGEVKNLHSKKCKNYTSSDVESTLQEVKNLHPNNTDNNYTDSDTDSSSDSRAGASKDDDRKTPSEKIKKSIRDRIGYGHIASEYPDRLGLLNRITRIASEAEAGLIPSPIVIHGLEYSKTAVKHKFSVLSERDVLKVLDRVSENSQSIGDLDGYLISALFMEAGKRARPAGTVATPQSQTSYANFEGRHYSDKEIDDIEKRLLQQWVNS